MTERAGADEKRWLPVCRGLKRSKIMKRRRTAMEGKMGYSTELSFLR